MTWRRGSMLQRLVMYEISKRTMCCSRRAS